jgi:hypothetical protein
MECESVVTKQDIWALLFLLTIIIVATAVVSVVAVYDAMAAKFERDLRPIESKHVLAINAIRNAEDDARISHNSLMDHIFNITANLDTVIDEINKLNDAVHLMSILSQFRNVRNEQTQHINHNSD